jgi:hypothetical protein
MKRKPPTPRDYSRYHVTNLLESAHLIAKGDVRYHEYQGHPLAIMSWGRIWEGAIDCWLADYATSHGGVYLPDMEQDRDGILCSLDGLMMLPDLGWMVTEIKLRFTRNTEIPLKHLQQVRAYCYAAGTDLVAYVSGHITSNPPDATAQLRIVRLTRMSIIECWQGLVHTKEHLEKQGCGPCSTVSKEGLIK